MDKVHFKRQRGTNFLLYHHHHPLRRNNVGFASSTIIVLVVLYFLYLDINYVMKFYIFNGMKMPSEREGEKHFGKSLLVQIAGTHTCA
jgi:hypothetical protein